MGLSVSQLRNRVTIQARATATDDWGQPVEQWQPHATCWADVRMVSGMEAAKAGAEISRTRVSVRIRFRDGINSGMRALIAGAVYDIKAVMPDLAGRSYVDLVCEAAQ